MQPQTHCVEGDYIIKGIIYIYIYESLDLIAFSWPSKRQGRVYEWGVQESYYVLPLCNDLFPRMSILGPMVSRL